MIKKKSTVISINVIQLEFELECTHRKGGRKEREGGRPEHVVLRFISVTVCLRVSVVYAYGFSIIAALNLWVVTLLGVE